MFSSSKILFSKSSVAVASPLSVAVQPQNDAISEGYTKKIGQTTWTIQPGYKRSTVTWQRSVNGIDWFPEDGSSTYEQDGGFYLYEANLAQSGLKYRALAYAYEQYTSLNNYMSPGGSPYESADQGFGTLGGLGRLKISAGGLVADSSFIFIKGGAFKLTLGFDGQMPQTAPSSNYLVVTASIANRIVGSIRTCCTQTDFANIGFSASPGELMKFDLQVFGTPIPTPSYMFSIDSVNADIPWVGAGVFTQPFTLTVR